MSNNTISVTVRVRPFASQTPSAKSSLEIIENKMLRFDCGDTSRPLGSIGKRRRKNQTYAFDRVFTPQHSTKAVFEQTALPAVRDALRGYNATVFAYGATGSGKTHTMIGNELGGPGLIVLSMYEVFASVGRSREKNEYEVSISYFEIYNEKIRDLLNPGAGRALPLRFSKQDGAKVVGLSEFRPKNAEEVSKLLAEGNLRRTQCPTDRNSESSRSHAVFQVRVKSSPRSDPSRTLSSKLSLIDLAGSERASATKNSGSVLREGANINRSLLALGNCINALCRKRKPSHVPYRDSILTRLLTDSLGGNCKTAMIATVSGSFRCIEDTANTLKYANNAKKIKVGAKKNQKEQILSYLQYQKIVAGLREEVARLKKLVLGFGGEVSGSSKTQIGIIEEEHKNLEESQMNMWKIKKKRLLLDIEGKSVKTQINYWTRYQKKLNLPKTPTIIKNLKQRYESNEAEFKRVNLSFEKQKNRAQMLKENLIDLVAIPEVQENSDQNGKTINRSALEKVRKQIERLKWREDEISELMAGQRKELIDLRERENTMRQQMSMLVEALCFQQAMIELREGGEMRGNRRAFGELNRKYIKELKNALNNASDIAKIHNFGELKAKIRFYKNLGQFGIKNCIFTPKKYSNKNMVDKTVRDLMDLRLKKVDSSASQENIFSFEKSENNKIGGRRNNKSLKKERSKFWEDLSRNKTNKRKITFVSKKPFLRRKKTRNESTFDKSQKMAPLRKEPQDSSKSKMLTPLRKDNAAKLE